MAVKKICLGDLLVLRKKHPCGSLRWRVLRVGADIGMVCEKCGHYVIMPRSKLEPRIRSIENSLPEEVESHARHNG